MNRIGSEDPDNSKGTCPENQDCADKPSLSESKGDTALLPVKHLDSKKEILLDLMKVCLKIGLTSFGAPTAHIAMMENEFVRKKGWVSEEQFLELLAAANLIPGPNASETCYHVGYLRAGYPGMLVAGISFISPALLSSLALAWAYGHYGALPAVDGLFYFLNPLVLAIVLDSSWRIGKSSLKGWQQILIFALVLAGILLKVNETLLLLGGGALGILLHYWLTKAPEKPKSAMLFSLAPWPLVLASVRPLLDVLSVAWERVGQIFLYFLRTGSVLFGSALVLFALIEKDVVTRFGWLTAQQLSDAIAIGQITPGPVLSASTFVGYMAGGFWGALAASVGVFLPSFVLVALTAPLLSRMRETPWASAFLKGVNAAVVALILAVCWQLGQNGLTDWVRVALFAGGLGLLAGAKWPPYALVLLGLGLGLARVFLF